MTINRVAKKAERFVIDNSPAIMTAIGVTGTLTTAYLTGRATFRAAEILHTVEAQQSFSGRRKLEKKEQFELVWKEYIPATATGALTVICIIGANRVGTRRAAALASAYTISERAFNEYREKVVEKLGEKKEEAVRSEISQDRVNKLPDNHQIIITGNGETLFMDSMSNYQFRTTMENVKKAVNDINFEIINDGYASLSEFYDKLEIPHTAISDELGWNSDERLEIIPTATIARDAEACIVINYRVAPFRRFNRTHG